MQTIIDFFSHFTNPEWIIQNGGLYIVILIVFIETGFPFGFFLPGDPLLFISGMMIANTLAPFSFSLLNLLYWVLLITAAGILGNFVGYWIGRKSDHFIMSSKDRWFFKKKYIFQAQEFYEKRGGAFIILARFLPVVRTFAPIVGGLVKMKWTKFAFYNFTGSFLWVASLVGAGYLLGENAWVKKNLEYIILGIVLITTLPVIFKMIAGRKKEPVQNVTG